MRPTSDPPRPGLEEALLLPYLPMIYVAWADGELEPPEIARICEELTAARGDGACGQLLAGWLDPQRPPDATELRQLLSAIRRGAAGAGEVEKLSLAELGLELARAGDREVAAAERAALAAVESALGLGGPGASSLVLPHGFPAALPEESPPAFSVDDMTRLLDGPAADLRRRLFDLLAQPRFAYPLDLDRVAYRERVLEWCRELAREGYGALSFPPEHGGAGDTRGFVAAFETLAFHDLSLLVKFGVQFGLFGGSILQLGGERHHREFLPAVGSLELPGGFAMTETDHGSNVAELETTARYDRERQEFEIHTPHDGARKDYIGNAAAHGRMMTVFAQLEIDGEGYGVHAFLVPVRDESGRVLPGVTIADDGEKVGLNGVDNGRIWFERVRVPRENLLDRFAAVSAEGEYSSPIASPGKRFFTMLGTLVGGRVSVAKAALSAAKSGLTIAIRYGARRRQFGPRGGPERVILDYLTHQRRLMPRLATTYALHFALEDLAAAYADAAGDGDRRELEAAAAGLKALSTWHAVETLQVCREACGGQGYLAANRFAALKADTDVFTTFEGDNFVLLQLVTKSLLTGFRRQFSDANLFGLARYVAGRAATAMAELNPLVVRNTDEEHLRDPEFQRAAFRWREDHLLAALARRMKKRLDAGLDPFSALNAVQDHAVATARAHVERRVLESFAAAVEREPHVELAAILAALRDLFALSKIEADRGWFQEHGYLEDAKAKAVRKTVIKLCRDTRQQALPLVDAFAIPDALLAAPIGLAEPPARPV